METNYSPTDQSAVLDQDLSIPHFDEDATLLSARPVVPLHEVKTEKRSRRRVIFGLTIIAAVVAGAISATLLLTQRGVNHESSAAEVSQPAVLSMGAAGGSTLESSGARLTELNEPDAELPTGEVRSVRSPSVKKRSPAPISRRPVEPVRDRRWERQRDEDFQSDERALRQDDRRRARREARRHSGERRERRRSDDLMRIREIFEGSPRP